MAAVKTNPAMTVAAMTNRTMPPTVGIAGVDPCGLRPPVEKSLGIEHPGKRGTREVTDPANLHAEARAAFR